MPWSYAAHLCGSGNCLREVRCTVQKQKPIALVHDPVRGGAPLEVIRNEECPDELRALVFNGRDVIEWHRVKARRTTATPAEQSPAIKVRSIRAHTGLSAREPQDAG